MFVLNFTIACGQLWEFNSVCVCVRIYFKYLWCFLILGTPWAPPTQPSLPCCVPCTPTSLLTALTTGETQSHAHYHGRIFILPLFQPNFHLVRVMFTGCDHPKRWHTQTVETDVCMRMWTLNLLMSEAITHPAVGACTMIQLTYLKHCQLVFCTDIDWFNPSNPKIFPKVWWNRWQPLPN